MIAFGIDASFMAERMAARLAKPVAGADDTSVSIAQKVAALSGPGPDLPDSIPVKKVLTCVPRRRNRGSPAGWGD